MWSDSSSNHLTPGKKVVSIENGAGWTPEPVLTHRRGEISLFLVSIRTPDRPVSRPVTLVTYIACKVKVKAVPLRTKQARGGGGVEVELYSYSISRYKGWMVNAAPQPLCSPERDAAPVVQEAGLASGTVWTGPEDVSPTDVRAPGPSRP